MIIYGIACLVNGLSVVKDHHEIGTAVRFSVIAGPYRGGCHSAVTKSPHPNSGECALKSTLWDLFTGSVLVQRARFILGVPHGS